MTLLRKALSILAWWLTASCAYGALTSHRYVLIQLAIAFGFGLVAWGLWPKRKRAVSPE